MCDHSSRIELLVSGQMPPDELEKFYLHLERCRDCGLTLDRLLAQDTLLGSLRIEPAANRNPEPEVVGPLLKRIQRLGSTHSAGASAPSAVDDTLGDILAPPQRRDEIGRLGPYRVLEVLGAGGMGAVYKAEDPNLKRPVALKVMLPSLAGDPAARQRFLREAQAAAALKHDHVVSIYQVAKFRDTPFLAMGKRRFVLNTGDWDVDLYDREVKLATKNATVTRGAETAP